MKNIQLIEINSEVGAGTRGASLGSQAIKIASIRDNSRYFEEHTSEKVPNENEVLFKEKDQSEGAKNITQVLNTCTKLADKVDEVMSSGAYPLVLAGDHSSAAGTIAGIKKHNPNNKVGVIWIDAHGDLHSPYTSPTGNMHGMPLAMSLAEDNQENVRSGRILTPEELELWTDLKNMSGVSPAIHAEDIVFFGVRDTEKEEDYLIEKHNIKQYSVTDVRAKGIQNVVTETANYLSKCDIIYISFDVDSMDCHYVSHGTGTPVPFGFSEEEAIDLVRQLLAIEKVGCFEITEVNPTLDEKKNRMAEAAFEVLKNATEVITG